MEGKDDSVLVQDILKSTHRGLQKVLENVCSEETVCGFTFSMHQINLYLHFLFSAHYFLSTLLSR